VCSFVGDTAVVCSFVGDTAVVYSFVGDTAVSVSNYLNSQERKFKCIQNFILK